MHSIFNTLASLHKFRRNTTDAHSWIKENQCFKLFGVTFKLYILHCGIYMSNKFWYVTKTRF